MWRFPINPEPGDFFALSAEERSITWDQLNSLCGHAVTPDILDELLNLFNFLGVTLIDDEVLLTLPPPADSQLDTHGRPRQPLQLRPYVRRPAFIEQLRTEGVAVTDAVVRLDGEAIYNAKLRVHGADALRVWRQLRDLVLALQMWPVIVPYEANDYEFATAEDEPPPPGEGVDYVYVRPRDDRVPVIELLTNASTRTPDPRMFHRWHTGCWENIDSDDWETMCAATTLPVAPGRKDLFGPDTPFRGHRDTRADQPHANVTIELVPTMQPWQVFAYKPFGGWNGAPYPEEQIAILRHWYDRYGAEVVTMSDDWYELYVPRLPRTRREALELIRELTSFGEETIFGYGSQSTNEMVHTVQTSHYWYFWWD